MTRWAVDAAPAFDQGTRRKVAVRSTVDAAPAADAAQSCSLHRRTPADGLAAATDLAFRAVAQVRTAPDRLLIPVDAGWWLQTHRVGFGPPVATLTATSRVKVGAEPGCDTVDLAFTFDQPVSAWTVRINGTGPFDGTAADQWEGGGGDGFGLQPFGISPFGRRDGLAVTSGTAQIAAADLRHGANTVVVYGRGLGGGWSFHPVGSLAATV